MSEQLPALYQQSVAEEFRRQLAHVVFVEDIFPPEETGVREPRRPKSPNGDEAMQLHGFGAASGWLQRLNLVS